MLFQFYSFQSGFSVKALTTKVPKWRTYGEGGVGFKSPLERKKKT